MYLATSPEANALLENDALALLIGMLLDQQIPMEKAFTSPWVLAERMGGTLDVTAIATYDPEAFEELFRTPPALHRFPVAMAKRVQQLARILIDTYDGDASRVWDGAASGDDLIKRLGALPGFGAVKARIFAGLLAKQLKVKPKGWREAASPFADPGTFQSVADVVDAKSLAKVRAHKKEMKAAAKV